MAKGNTSMRTDFQMNPREIDFVSRFQNNWEHLTEILGIVSPIKKQPGTMVKIKRATVTLQNGAVGEGEDIPYSKAVIDEVPYEEMAVEKYAKAVTLEAIKEYGYDAAVGMTDDAFLFELQSRITGKFYTYLNTGTLTGSYASFQMALSMAKGLVEDKFKRMRRAATGVVGFVNLLDMYEYLGNANVTVQNQFGFQYIKDFMGYNTIFLLSGDDMARGKIVATPVENIVLYYVDPADSDFQRAGLVYTTVGDVNLLGFHTEGNYHTAVSEAFAIMGITLFAEYQDAIAVVTVNGGDEAGG